MESSKLGFNISYITEATKLPNFVGDRLLPEHIKDLVVVLKPTDFEELPDFLQGINENASLKSCIKNKGQMFIYGRAGDKFERCLIKVSSFKDIRTTLSDGADIARTLLSSNLLKVSLYFSQSFTKMNDISTFLQGFCLANYKFNRKGEKGGFKRISSVTVYHNEYDINSKEAQDIINSAKYPLFCREIVNSRASEATPEAMLELCKQIAKIDPNVTIEAIAGKELLLKGLNLIYSVGKGGLSQPSLAIMKYQGNPEKPEDLIALIGSGVCFDAGGLNYKKTGSIENTYLDKGGACSVLATFKGIVEMKLPVNVVIGMPFVDNLLSPDAYHPSDILKSYKGLTIEVGNTDSEGLLILADTMSYIQLNYKPHTIIEISTLTATITSAIGKNLAGIFSNNKTLRKDLTKIGNEVGENLWKLPIEMNHSVIEGVYADLTNHPKNIASAGSSISSAFLKRFVEEGVKWALIDIAGIKSVESEKFVYSGGATGFGVQLMMNYLRKYQQNEEKKEEKVGVEKK